MRALRYLGWAALAILVVIGLVLVVMWRGDIPYATLEQRYAQPTSHYLDTPDGLHVHYRDEGKPDGPPLVLVHGFGASAADWDDWTRQLGDTYHIIAPDLPGHGLTRAPKGYQGGGDGQVKVVDTVVSSLGLTRFAIAGNSMGGAVAWRYALAHPDKVSALVLVDAAGWPPAKGGSRNDALIFKLLANPVARSVIKNLDNSALVKQGMEAAFIDKRLVTPALVKRYTDFSRAPGHRDILTSRQGPPEQPASAALLSAITAPTLVMVGQNDRLIPYTDGQRFADAIPGSRLIVYPGVGHAPMEQIPDKSAADLRAWLSSPRTVQNTATAAWKAPILVRQLPPARPPK